jgi:hypothetical protein
VPSWSLIRSRGTPCLPEPRGADDIARSTLDRRRDPRRREPHRSVWRELGDAIRSTNADDTKIPLRRAVLLLAVPMVLELVLESTFAVIDIWFVAKLGPSAVATVALTETSCSCSTRSASALRWR